MNISAIQECASFVPNEGPAAEDNGLGRKVEFDNQGYMLIKEAKIETPLEDVLKIDPVDSYADTFMRKSLENLCIIF